MNTEIMKKLTSIIEENPSLDQVDYNGMDYFGFNFDDAYHLGFVAGEKSLAEWILKTWKEEVSKSGQTCTLCRGTGIMPGEHDVSNLYK